MFTTIAANADPSLLHLAFGMPGGWEWIILLVIGLLIFGRRLPEVGRWLGQGIVEFKKGVKGITDDIEEESASKPRSPERLESTPSQQTAPSQPVEQARQPD